MDRSATATAVVVVAVVVIRRHEESFVGVEKVYIDG
jgi:hypothetical protein